MKTTVKYTLLIALFILPFRGMAQAQIAVVVNADNPATDSTMEQMKRIYLGTVTVFSDGQRIMPGEYASLKEQFYKIVLNMTVKRLRKHWIKVVFSGGNSTPPRGFKNPDKAKEFISKNRGAVFFIDFLDVDGSVKVLTIEDKRPGDDGSPLM